MAIFSRNPRERIPRSMISAAEHPYARALLDCIAAPTSAAKAEVLENITIDCGTSWIVPDIPKRPGRPDDYEEREQPARRRRGLHDENARHRFLLAIHHIELSAIDLTMMMCLRTPNMPSSFHADQIGVARDEALHASMLDELCSKRGYPPGTFAIHHRLWDSARGRTRRWGTTRHRAALFRSPWP